MLMISVDLDTRQVWTSITLSTFISTPSQLLANCPKYWWISNVDRTFNSFNEAARQAAPMTNANSIVSYASPPVASLFLWVVGLFWFGCRYRRRRHHKHVSYYWRFLCQLVDWVWFWFIASWLYLICHDLLTMRARTSLTYLRITSVGFVMIITCPWSHPLTLLRCRSTYHSQWAQTNTTPLTRHHLYWKKVLQTPVNLPPPDSNSATSVSLIVHAEANSRRGYTRITRSTTWVRCLDVRRSALWIFCP